MEHGMDKCACVYQNSIRSDEEPILEYADPKGVALVLSGLPLTKDNRPAPCPFSKDWRATRQLRNFGVTSLRSSSHADAH